MRVVRPDGGQDGSVWGPALERDASIGGGEGGGNRVKIQGPFINPKPVALELNGLGHNLTSQLTINNLRPTSDSLPFMGSFPRASHPATLIHPACLYPHTPHLWDAPGDTPLIIDALPESRFYSKKGNIVSLLRAGHPNAPALPVLDTEFWRLIATHPTAHNVVPQARSVYDGRPSDIYSLLETIPCDLAQHKLSWTTSPFPYAHTGRGVPPHSRAPFPCPQLDYLIPEHCTLLNDALAPFSHDITYLTDGLDQAHTRDL